FAEHVFKLEQQLYVEEQIQWRFINYSDNTPTIEMIEGKLGILPLLDEESRLPSGSDQGVADKLFRQFDTPKHKNIFAKPRFSNSAFTIRHYACEVTYEAEGFIDKNKDTVPDELMAVKPTLGLVFKSSLISLMDRIKSTNVHYIRCIKPNDTKEPWGFSAPTVLNQLRACGVLETIRISCAGYPSRWTFAEFVDRYYLLVHSSQWTSDPKLLCQAILKSVISVEDNYQLAYLERKRSETLNRYTTLIQKSARRMVAQNRYRRLRRACVLVQTGEFARIAQRVLRGLREDKAAATLQSRWRAHKYADARRTLAAVRIQAAYRKWHARSRYVAYRRAVVFAQSCVRRKYARRELAELRAEARSASHLKEVSYALENKVFELTQSLQKQERENSELHANLRELEASCSEFKKQAESNQRNAQRAAERLAAATAGFRAELGAAVAEKRALQGKVWSLSEQLPAKDEQISAKDAEITKLTQEIHRLREELASRRFSPVRSRATSPLRSAAPAAPPEWRLPTPDAAAVAAIQRENEQPNVQPAKPLAVTTNRGTTAAVPLVELGSHNGAGPLLGSKNAVDDPEHRPNRRHSSAERSFKEASKTARITKRPQPADAATGRDSAEGAVGEIIRLPPPAANAAPAHDHYRKAIPTRRLRSPGLPLAIAINDAEDNRKAREAQALIKALNDPALVDEIVDSLVRNLLVPLPSTQNRTHRRDILFPAHLIGLCTTQMRKYQLNGPLQSLMAVVVSTIQEETLSKAGDDYTCAFWLSNTRELYAIVRTAERKHDKPHQSPPYPRQEAADKTATDRVAQKIEADLKALLQEIYHIWLQEIKKRLVKMIIPGIVESQSLSGVTATEGGFLKRFMKQAQPTITVDGLLNLFTKISKTMTVRD
ncbi:MAG: P-loop containing nucleoside triphosphate hydrolase protein, partial [Olpidium bornovanus]